MIQFIAGMFVGTMLGVAFMCLFQINNSEDDKE